MFFPTPSPFLRLCTTRQGFRCRTLGLRPLDPCDRSGLAVSSIAHTLVKYLITGSTRLEELLLLAATELSSRCRRVQAGKLCSTLARAGAPSVLYDKDKVFRCSASGRQKNFHQPIPCPRVLTPEAS